MTVSGVAWFIANKSEENTKVAENCKQFLGKKVTVSIQIGTELQLSKIVLGNLKVRSM